MSLSDDISFAVKGTTKGWKVEKRKTDVRVFVLHDFDLSGFKILRSLTEEVRLSYGSDVIDLGLRMADIKDLTAEPVRYKQQSNPSIYLKYDCGATLEEIDFLVDSSCGYYSHRGHHVEINAMTSEQLRIWLEGKLEEYGVEKFIPDQDALSIGYRHAFSAAVVLLLGSAPLFPTLQNQPEKYFLQPIVTI